ncbi:MAG: MBL fold metallo-hydrolase [Chloroflexi bacterium]|nr:MBL fold metallo-hydrolase [Chloroflexota bacterium]
MPVQLTAPLQQPPAAGNPGFLSAKMLASGSSGNCLLVRSATTTLLIDLGLPARTVAAFLESREIPPAAVEAILLSHEHTDHLVGLGTFARKYQVPVVAEAQTLAAARSAVGRLPARTLARGSTITLGDCEVSAFPVPHDAAAPAGFLIRSGGWTIAYCVDLGSADETLVEPLRQADLVVLEANHDYDALRAGPYTPSLKARILSPFGHLSNLEAGRLIAASASSRPRTVWLAHLSAVNNSPRLALRVVGGLLKREGVSGVRLETAARDRPSLHWSSHAVGWQLPLVV